MLRAAAGFLRRSSTTFQGGTMQRFNKTRSSSTAPWWIAMMAVVIASPGVHAAAWTAAAGAQTNNKGKQALAFLPNEMWIRAGDAITWKVDTDEVHTMP